MRYGALSLDEFISINLIRQYNELSLNFSTKNQTFRTLHIFNAMLSSHFCINLVESLILTAHRNGDG